MLVVADVLDQKPLENTRTETRSLTVLGSVDQIPWAKDREFGAGQARGRLGEEGTLIEGQGGLRSTILVRETKMHVHLGLANDGGVNLATSVTMLAR